MTLTLWKMELQVTVGHRRLAGTCNYTCIAGLQSKGFPVSVSTRCYKTRGTRVPAGLYIYARVAYSQSALYIGGDSRVLMPTGTRTWGQKGLFSQNSGDLAYQSSQSQFWLKTQKIITQKQMAMA